MNATKMAEMIGRAGVISGPGDMRIEVSVIDAKTTYGRVRYQVRPAAGHGSAWIDSSSFTLYAED